MNDTVVKNDLRTMHQGLLVDLLEAGFGKDQIKAMPEPEWSLLIVQLGLSNNAANAFRRRYREVTDGDLAWSDFQTFFDKDNKTILLVDLSRVLDFVGIQGKNTSEIKKILQRYKGGRMAGISHTRLLEILPANPDFEVNVYTSALADGINEPLAFELASMISKSAYHYFVEAKAAGIDEADLLQYFRVDLPPLLGSIEYLYRPIETYVTLRTSECGLLHTEAVEVVARLGSNPDGRRLYLTLRNTGCSHVDSIGLASYTFVQDLLVRGDAIGLDVRNSIEVSRLFEILAMMPVGVQVSLCKAIEYYNQES